MTKKLISITLLIAFFMNQATAQTYIGEVLYRNTYEYIKLKCKGDSCEFSMPYQDGQQKYPLQLNPAKTQDWEVRRGVEKWKFNTTLKDGVLRGDLQLPTGQQGITLKEQRAAIPKEELGSYVGVFQDDSNRKAIVYSRYDYLHLISPYSEETMSLKPTGKDAFWSVSGEESLFLNQEKGTFQVLVIKDRNGAERQLKRSSAIVIEKLWIPIGEDTLYAHLYRPQSDGKVPACLILPGGGAVGMDNYEYEARYFAAHGIASLLFDKRGNGLSKGTNHFQNQTFEEKNEQYKQLFRYLQKHAAVDANRVGVHGPSEGGRLALMMAIDLKEEIAFVNAVAAPLMTFIEGQFYAMDQHHRILGIDEIDNMHIQQIWKDYYAGIANGKIDAETIEKANHYRSLNQRLFIPPDFLQVPASPKKNDLSNDRVVVQAGEITCPILLQYGENDQRVNGPKSLRNFLPKLQPSTQPEVIIYKRGSHSLMTPEYKICPGYLDDKVKWLRQIGLL